MIILIQILLVTGLGGYYYANRSQLDKLTLSLLISKLIACCAFVFIYQNYLKGDLSSYIGFANTWNKLGNDIDLLMYNKGIDAHMVTFRPRQLLFGKLFYIISKSTFFNSYATSCTFVSISFIWLLESVKLVKRVIPEYLFSFLVTLFVPTILFWTSGITKELLCFPAFLYMILYVYTWFKRKGTVMGLPLFIVSFLLVATLRYFYLPLFFILIFTYLVQNNYKKWMFWVVSVFGILMYMYFQELLILQLQTKYINMLLYKNYHLMVAKSGVDNYISLTLEDDSFISLLFAGFQSFKGLFFVNFRNAWLSLVSLENIVVLVASIWGLLMLKKRQISVEVIAMILFIIVSASLFQLVSPNYGSLSRYRVVHWFFMTWLAVQQFNIRFRSR